MKIGFDWGGVLDEFGEYFAQIASALRKDGHQVYVISAVEPGNEAYQKIFISPQFADCDEVITVGAMWEDQPKAKLVVCQEKGIEWFFDDREDTNILLRHYGIMAFTVKRLG